MFTHFVLRGLMALGFVGVLVLPALAADGLDTGDTDWILSATALVLFMTLPGLALFYAGLVQSKNIISVLMHHFAIACLMSVLWVVSGYSLAFSGDGAWFGNLDNMFLGVIGVDSMWAPFWNCYSRPSKRPLPSSPRRWSSAPMSVR